MNDTAPRFYRMPWIPRDFASSTRTWPLVARAVYRELLDAQWDIGGMSIGTLPDDADELRLLARATPTEWRIAWKYVEPKFPLVESGRRNARLEEHRANSNKQHAARALGAAKTNAKRWGNRGVAT